MDLLLLHIKDKYQSIGIPITLDEYNLKVWLCLSK